MIFVFGIGCNGAWQHAPGAKPRTCADRVFVPETRLTLGARASDPHKDEDETPHTSGVVQAFWADACPVSAGEFARVAERLHEASPEARFYSADETPPGWLGRCNLGSPRMDHPVNCVSVDAARAFCRLRGGDLPTEAEWEALAVGERRTDYPWGDVFVAERVVSSVPCRVRGCAEGTRARTSQGPRCVASGACDMSGNVWQWTRSPYASRLSEEAFAPRGTAASFVIKGGGWVDEEPARFRRAFRGRAYAKHGLTAIGFRCIYR